MFDSLTFKAMQSSIQALWIKQQVISQNIANYETPGYKTKAVSFQNVLENELNQSGAFDFKAVVNETNNTVVRPDGNNVDIDKENMELYKTYVQSVYLYEKISGQFTNMQYVLSQAMK